MPRDKSKKFPILLRKIISLSKKHATRQKMAFLSSIFQNSQKVPSRKRQKRKKQEKSLRKSKKCPVLLRNQGGREHHLCPFHRVESITLPLIIKLKAGFEPTLIVKKAKVLDPTPTSAAGRSWRWILNLLFNQLT